MYHTATATALATLAVCASVCAVSAHVHQHVESVAIHEQASAGDDGQDKTSKESRPQKPATHVLFFLIDDLGYADVGYHGNPVGSAVVTPTIDALSAAGVRLENCESASMAACTCARTYICNKHAR
jgi:hypothetical protein